MLRHDYTWNCNKCKEYAIYFRKVFTGLLEDAGLLSDFDVLENYADEITYTFIAQRFHRHIPTKEPYQNVLATISQTISLAILIHRPVQYLATN